MEPGKKKKLYNLRKLYTEESVQKCSSHLQGENKKSQSSAWVLLASALSDNKRIFKHVKSNMRCKVNTQWEEKADKFNALFFPSFFYIND